MNQKNSTHEDNAEMNITREDLLTRTKELIQILDSPTRFNLLQALFVYRRLNLSQLSHFLEVSKSTVLHHLKKFESVYEKLHPYTLEVAIRNQLCHCSIQMSILVGSLVTISGSFSHFRAVICSMAHSVLFQPIVNVFSVHF